MPVRACSLKLVSSTSAPSSRRYITFKASGLRKFKDTKRLFRFCISKFGLATSVVGDKVVPPCFLQASPLNVSTLMISAPHSANTRPHMGPASIDASSTTLIPSKGFICSSSYFPLKLGLRFSINACVPSFRSSVLRAIVCAIFSSISPVVISVS